MEIVISKKPSLYIQEKEWIVSLGDLKFKKVALEDLVKVNDLSKVTKTILSKALHLLTKSSTSFSISSITEERDFEDETWKYVVVKIKVEVEDFNPDEIIKYAYSGLDPIDATKVLLVFERV